MWRLHRIVHWINRIAQRCDDFMTATQGVRDEQKLLAFGEFLLNENHGPVRLVTDNDTRWNSVLFMIERALALKDSIEIFCWRATRDGALANEEVLTDDD